MNRQDPMRERARHDAVRRQAGALPPGVTLEELQPGEQPVPARAPVSPSLTEQPGPLPKPLIR